MEETKKSIAATAACLLTYTAISPSLADPINLPREFRPIGGVSNNLAGYLDLSQLYGSTRLGGPDDAPVVIEHQHHRSPAAIERHYYDDNDNLRD